MVRFETDTPNDSFIYYTAMRIGYGALAACMVLLGIDGLASDDRWSVHSRKYIRQVIPDHLQKSTFSTSAVKEAFLHCEAVRYGIMRLQVRSSCSISHMHKVVLPFAESTIFCSDTFKNYQSSPNSQTFNGRTRYSDSVLCLCSGAARVCTVGMSTELQHIS